MKSKCPYYTVCKTWPSQKYCFWLVMYIQGLRISRLAKYISLNSSWDKASSLVLICWGFVVCRRLKIFICANEIMSLTASQ